MISLAASAICRHCCRSPCRRRPSWPAPACLCACVPQSVRGCICASPLASGALWKLTEGPSCRASTGVQTFLLFGRPARPSMLALATPAARQCTATPTLQRTQHPGAAAHLEQAGGRPLHSLPRKEGKKSPHNPAQQSLQVGTSHSDCEPIMVSWRHHRPVDHSERPSLAQDRILQNLIFPVTLSSCSPCHFFLYTSFADSYYTDYRLHRQSARLAASSLFWTGCSCSDSSRRRRHRLVSSFRPRPPAAPCPKLASSQSAPERPIKTALFSVRRSRQATKYSCLAGAARTSRSETR